MLIDYDGSHSITFYDYRAITTTDDASISSHTYNTWTSWHLVPATPPTIKPYEYEVSIASVPGSNRVVDLSEALVGKILHGRHSGEWDFIMDTEREKKTPWDLFYIIRSDIHGKFLAVVLDDAPGHTFTGRIYINDLDIGSQYAKIKIGYDLGSRGSSKISTRKAGWS